MKIAKNYSEKTLFATTLEMFTKQNSFQKIQKRGY